MASHRTTYIEHIINRAFSSTFRPTCINLRAKDQAGTCAISLWPNSTWSSGRTRILEDHHPRHFMDILLEVRQGARASFVAAFDAASEAHRGDVGYCEAPNVSCLSRRPSRGGVCRRLLGLLNVLLTNVWVIYNWEGSPRRGLTAGSLSQRRDSVLVLRNDTKASMHDLPVGSHSRCAFPVDKNQPRAVKRSPPSGVSWLSSS